MNATIKKGELTKAAKLALLEKTTPWVPIEVTIKVNTIEEARLMFHTLNSVNLGEVLKDSEYYEGFNRHDVDPPAMTTKFGPETFRPFHKYLKDNDYKEQIG